MNILAIGQTVIDEIILLDQSFKNGEKINSRKTLLCVGGPSAVGSLLLSRLGHKVFFATTLAKDKEGYEAIKIFKKEKINLIPFYQSKTQRNIVIVDPKTAERTIIKDSNEPKPILRLDPSLIKKADLILLDRHQTYIFDQIMTFKKSSAPIIFDPSTEISPKTLKILRLIKYPILPYETTKHFGKTSFSQALNKMKEKIKHQFILTCSKFGALLVNSKIKLFPAYKTKAVDVSGAGDIFRAGFSHAILTLKNLNKAIDFANKVAALHCKKLGNSTALPTKEEIENSKLIKNNYSLQNIVKSLKFKSL